MTDELILIRLVSSMSAIDDVYSHSHVTHNGFPQISHAASYREKGASKRSYLNRLWKHNISRSCILIKNVHKFKIYELFNKIDIK
jgi:hypothetical protein